MTAQSATILDGKVLAAKLREQVRQKVATLRAQGVIPRLDAVIVGTSDTAARQYAERQGEECRALGLEYRLHEIHAGAGFDDIAGRVLLLNENDAVSGIMVHLPLPKGVDTYKVQRLIHPKKDIEGVNPANIGNVVYGRSSLMPCTALAAMRMIESTGIDIRGKTAVVVGAGNVVGKPLAVLLMRAEATVISCNKFTPKLQELTSRADILIAAAGVPGLVTAAMVKPGAIVIDVGVNRVSKDTGKTVTVGDVCFDEVSRVAGWISPVPGGVGPMTVAALLSNAVDASDRNRSSED
ncbi:MAG: bifunctional 5,10-methylene-tetrahydrofolate dehydrogenase/5,10-methylene-tetrahydrofolate cyclohydrolase [Phycisphaera sp.]|nr:MAG: bifunctional 5,10-methylene-tetrahydrofolate dehydrogenase/5,10-methylene-tetrahydrofolate cyclohydrolase [Phycisphaera sp.]